MNQPPIAPQAQPSPFSTRTVLALLIFGALTFIAALYFLGSGQTGDDLKDGNGHAASNGLNGYRGLTVLAQTLGADVSISRNAARLEDQALLVITPSHFTSAQDLSSTLENRRSEGPTLLVLPKWHGTSVPGNLGLDAKEGWVFLTGASSPQWAQELDTIGPLDLEIEQTPDAEEASETARWSGFGLTGDLPDARFIQHLGSDAIIPLVRDSDGRVLAGYVQDGGFYPDLAMQAGVDPGSEDDLDGTRWGLVIVAEPDLLNNYGLADRDGARLAIALLDAAGEGYDQPIIFDLTVIGLGQSENLLTLAFRPPFLAATLCLIIAGIVIAWRAFLRFGAPLAAGPGIAFGKRQLVSNGARLILRVQRFHLLGPPYADLLTARFARILAIRTTSDTAQTEAEIERLLAARKIDAPPYGPAAQALRNARTPHELLRAASVLKRIERNLAS